MWSHDELMAIDEAGGLHIDEIPPELRALIPEEDLCAIAEDEMLDYSTVLYLAQAEVYELPQPGTREWVLTAIAANSGDFWITKLCRAMHGHRENIRSISWCGVCSEYANVRKRRRAAKLPPKPLPGFEEIGGAFQLHPPCSNHGLTWLRKLIYRLENKGQVERSREPRPDIRQARGWDYMSVLNHSERE